jgi:hypothetical protein
MGNGLYRRHGEHFRGEGIAGASESTCLVIEEPQVVIHKTEQPDFIAGLLDADIFASEDGTEIDLSASETDAAAVGDGDGSVVERIVQPSSRHVPPSWQRSLGSSGEVM